MGFLHCLRHRKPACLVLIGAIYFNNLPIRDLHPLEFLTTFVVEVYARHTHRFCVMRGDVLLLTILCIIEVRFFVSSAVLKSPHERKAAKRQAVKKLAFLEKSDFFRG